MLRVVRTFWLFFFFFNERLYLKMKIELNSVKLFV